jgi:hypothetical protein
VEAQIYWAPPGSSSVRLECTVRDREVGGSNPPFPTRASIGPSFCDKPVHCAGSAGGFGTLSDGRRRRAISQLLQMARAHDCRGWSPRTSTSGTPASRAAKSQDGDRHAAGAARASGGWWRASPAPGSVAAWCRCPPTGGWRWWPWTLTAPADGVPSTGSASCRSSRQLRAGTRRQRSSAADAGSASDHGDGKGVTEPDQRIGNGGAPGSAG